MGVRLLGQEFVDQALVDENGSWATLESNLRGSICMNRPTCRLLGPFALSQQTALRSLSAVALSFVGGLASAQTITSAAVGVVGVPVGNWFALVATAAALAGSAVWILRGGRRKQRLPWFLAAVMMVGGISNSQSLWAQILAQFTQPAGEALPITVTPIVAGGMLQGFEPVDFLNASGKDLQIAAIDPPDFNDCFSTSPPLPLPPPGSGGPPACAAGLGLAVGASCRVNVDAICKALAAQATAAINMATPTSLSFPTNSTVTVVVSADPASPVPAQNVAATIPGGSGIAVQSSTCPVSLAPGASCSIAFTSAVAEGPTIVEIAGTNTASLTVNLTVATPPSIAISAPVQQARIIGVGGAALALTVTNDAGSVLNATGITVTNKAQAPDMAVDDTDCASVAPGASCTLLLTSNTPYAPVTITIGGSNTVNSPTAAVAFSYLGGLVFQESGGSGKVVIDAAQEFTSMWTGASADIPGATSPSNGASNTNAIVADASCNGDPSNCAAQQCRNIGADWYLPARDELVAVHSALCSNSALPCTFGGFTSGTRWNSTQAFPTAAQVLSFPSGLGLGVPKNNSARARCVRAFTP
jgi:hypothetical protein